VQSVSKINTSYSVKTSDYTYTHNPSGAGSDYYIGRITSKTESVSAYGDTKSDKEEYTYENNRLKTLKNGTGGIRLMLWKLLRMTVSEILFRKYQATARIPKR
jgi:hypothetical protein